MSSKITKTVGGNFQINKTGSIVEPGMRVAAGSGEDYDNGRIDSINGNLAQVSWDSGVCTPLNLTQDDVRIMC